MFEDDEIRLKHILDAAREAVGFTEGHYREDLDTDRKLSLSLVRLLEIIGEAAKGITAEFRQEHSRSYPGKVWSECVTGLFMAILMLILILYGRQ